MNIQFPTREEIPQLRALWREAFGDSEEYLDAFFRAGFSEDRCRCFVVDGRVISALYWLDVTCSGHRFAYLYAIATAQAMRRKGVFRALMEDTHAHLTQRGYAGTILVPEGEALAEMYGKFGYSFFSGLREFSCDAPGRKMDISPIPAWEYAARRSEILGNQAVQYGEPFLEFLSSVMCFYAGEGIILAGYTEGENLICKEFLGDPACAPSVLSSLGCKRGSFRIPGEERRFAMFRPLISGVPVPGYYSFALD